MKITVITVCKNSEKSIEKTIKSILNQKYHNVEYIIIDGQSIDKTLSIINTYKNSISKIISETDDGIYSAINKGIKISTGDVVSILHSDDVFYDEMVLSDVARNFQENNNLECLIGTTIMKMKFKDYVLRKYSPINFKKWMFYIGISPPHPSMFVKRSIYNKYGAYKENYKIAADFEFYLRVIMKNKISYQLTDKNLVVMRYGGASTKSIKSNFIATKEILNSFKTNGLYTNWFFVSLRFLFKLLQFVFKK
tara:strand:+ start:2147 stop:2899 length:753 start_codon:yes stop_codon:yes gene_type:complete